MAGMDARAKQQRAARIWRAVAQSNVAILDAVFVNDDDGKELQYAAGDAAVIRGLAVRAVSSQNLGFAKRVASLQFPVRDESDKCSPPTSIPLSETTTHSLITDGGHLPVRLPPLCKTADDREQQPCLSLAGRPEFCTVAVRKPTSGDEQKEEIGTATDIVVEVWGASTLRKGSALRETFSEADVPVGCERVVVVPASTHGSLFKSTLDLLRIERFYEGSQSDDQPNQEKRLQSTSELLALYVAEAPNVPRKAVMDPKLLAKNLTVAAAEDGSANNGEASVGGDDGLGGPFDFQETWGEGRGTESSGRVYLLNFDSWEVLEVPLSTKYSYTSPQFVVAPTHFATFIVIGQAVYPFRLGTVACQNREQVLLYVEVDVTRLSKATTTIERRSATRVVNLSLPTDLAPAGFSICPIPSRTSSTSSTTATSSLNAKSSMAASADLSGVNVLHTAVGRTAEESRTHLGCLRLNSTNITFRPPTTPVLDNNDSSRGQVVDGGKMLVGSVAEPREGDNFAGLYTPSNIKFRFSKDGAFAFYSTCIGCAVKVVAVELATGRVVVPSIKVRNSAFDSLWGGEDQACQCFTLYDVRDDKLLLAASSPTVPTVLACGVWDVDSFSISIISFMKPTHCWESSFSGGVLRPLPSSADIRGALSHSARWSVFKGRHVEASAELPSPFAESTATVSRPQPLAVILHGGPHATSSAGYSTAITFLLMCGFGVFTPNYRGSLGFGQKELLSLPGSIGKQDVQDVVEAVQEFVNQSDGKYSMDHVYCLGGSHGGFLTLHLIGQHPQMFVAVSARNPCTNIAGQMTTSDIPDWSFHEAAGLREPYAPLTAAAQWQRMVDCSPVQNVGNVVTPLLLGLGQQDRRVPISQSFEYVKLLRDALTAKFPGTDGAGTDDQNGGENGLDLFLASKLRVLVYPDAGHPIEQPKYESDYWVNTLLWFDKQSSSSS